jgi:hypothetical protein
LWRLSKSGAAAGRASTARKRSANRDRCLWGAERRASAGRLIEPTSGQPKRRIDQPLSSMNRTNASEDPSHRRLRQVSSCHVSNDWAVRSACFARWYSDRSDSPSVGVVGAFAQAPSSCPSSVFRSEEELGIDHGRLIASVCVLQPRLWNVRPFASCNYGNRFAV